MRKTPFQTAIEGGVEPTVEVLLSEIAARLASYNGYPPILPHAGQVIFAVLSEAKAGKAKQHTDD
jgi:hypothetical protein